MPIRICLVSLIALAACLEPPEPGDVRAAVQKAEEKVTSIEVENATGDNAVNVILKYKQGDAAAITVHASLPNGAGVQIIDGDSKLTFVELKMGGGGAKYKVEDGGTITRDGLKIRKLKVIKKDGFAPSELVAPSACLLVAPTPTDDEGESVETVPGAAGCDCFGCPDPEPVPGPDPEPGPLPI